MMNGSTSKIHSENPPNSLPKGAKSRLLGIIREERLLGHDLDIDFGVIIEDAHTREKVQRALKNGGCELKKHLSSMAMSLNSLTLIVALNLIFAFMKMRLIIPSVICSM